jgi:hypothetical protein
MRYNYLTYLTTIFPPIVVAIKWPLNLSLVLPNFPTIIGKIYLYAIHVFMACCLYTHCCFSARIRKYVDVGARARVCASANFVRILRHYSRSIYFNYSNK